MASRVQRRCEPFFHQQGATLLLLGLAGGCSIDQRTPQLASDSTSVEPLSAVDPAVTDPVSPAPVSPGDADQAGPEEPGAMVPVTPGAPPVLAPQLPPEPEPTDEPAGTSTCRTAIGVSGAPRNLPEAITLLNTLPRPTTLACFLSALERPLQLYLTRSNQSLQPSPGARSPRVFVVNKPLLMSIVLEGEASITLQLGYQTTDTRSIKTELVFPLQRDVSSTNLFDEVKDQASGTTRCANCHAAEVEFFDPELQANVFESDLLPPLEVDEVDLESVRAENERCDATQEPERCALLSALFDHGLVMPAPNGISFAL
jgi:hypothetical protein